MAIRTILYGYKVKDGKTIIHKEESDVVKKVFSLYLEGKTLKDIADMLIADNVIYFQGEAKWNKNTISRMLENDKYMGNDVYPMIISFELFNKAREIRDKKSCKQIKQPMEIELLREITICGKCGSRYKRVNTWGSREKWMCSNGCGCLAYIDDASFEKALTDNFNLVIDNPEVICKLKTSNYHPTREVLKEENELYRLLEQPSIDFKTISRSILHGASIRFDFCDFDSSELTDELKEELSSRAKVDSMKYNDIKKYIRQIVIEPDGRIISVFINNSRITVKGDAEYGSC